MKLLEFVYVRQELVTFVPYYIKYMFDNTNWAAFLATSCFILCTIYERTYALVLFVHGPTIFSEINSISLGQEYCIDKGEKHRERQEKNMVFPFGK